MGTNTLVITNLFFSCQYQENDSVFLINNLVTSYNYIKIIFHHRISFEIPYVCLQNIFFWISFYPKIILRMASLYMCLNQSPENEWQWGLVATLPDPWQCFGFVSFLPFLFLQSTWLPGPAPADPPSLCCAGPGGHPAPSLSRVSPALDSLLCSAKPRSDGFLAHLQAASLAPSSVPQIICIGDFSLNLSGLKSQQVHVYISPQCLRGTRKMVFRCVVGFGGNFSNPLYSSLLLIMKISKRPYSVRERNIRKDVIVLIYTDTYWTTALTSIMLDDRNRIVISEFVKT